MDIEQQKRIQELFKKIVALKPPTTVEDTIFSIGGRGHYENPTTDILAFFLDTNASHGLESLVLQAFIECLPEDYHSLDCTLNKTPEREVKTQSGKRIDLLLESQEWVIVMENKIFHQQNNPFSDYENYVKEARHEERYTAKEVVFVVLSPSGSANRDDWHGVSYPTLIEAIKRQLADYFLAQPLGKWFILLREFILHLESLMSNPALPQESIQFVLDHLSELKQAQIIQDQAIKAYQQELSHYLSIELNREMTTSLNTWHGYPAIRFSDASWPTDSDVVLFLDGRDNKFFCINYYAAKIKTDEQREIADKHFKEDDCGTPWNEIKNTYRCYKARFNNFDQATIKDKLVHKLKLMDDFETKKRPTLDNNC
tara:strand:+ start:19833 stop:20942 length:1110 start_codon:yes stop_codon:yes gene_type:complete